MAASKPFLTVYATPAPLGGPNPSKIFLYLQKLGLEYETAIRNFDNDEKKGVKGADFLAINPNGRLPALIDHSEDDLMVWESGAILNYLSEKFDKDGKFSGKTLTERAKVQTWLFHQVSGLGPVQGQVMYMNKFFKPIYGEEAPDSVKKRFRDEVERLYQVLNSQLERQEKAGSKFIVLDRLTIADIAFFGWVGIASAFGIELALYPKVEAWNRVMQDDVDVLAVHKRFPPAH